MPKWEYCRLELHLDDEFRAIELISYTPDQTARMTVPLEDPPWPVPFGERFLSSVDYTWSKTIFSLGNDGWEAFCIDPHREDIISDMAGVAWFFKRPR